MLKITKNNKELILRILYNLLSLWIGQIAKDYYHLSDIKQLIFDELCTDEKELLSIGVKIEDFLPEDMEFDFRRREFDKNMIFDNEEEEMCYMYDNLSDDY